MSHIIFYVSPEEKTLNYVYTFLCVKTETEEAKTVMYNKQATNIGFKIVK